MKNISLRWLLRAICLYITISGALNVQAQVNLTAVNTPYTENFNTLAQTGTSSTVPTGFTFVESGNNANTTYNSATGSASTGDTYSYGVANPNPVSDRAFGGLRSGTLIPTIGASFVNNTGITITSLVIGYTGEQWRIGDISGRTDQLIFEYSTNATSLTTGSYTAVPALSFTTPSTTGPIGAKNGNVAANRTLINGTLTGLLIAPGATFWIRFTDFDATGGDDGLAIDDFSLTVGCPSVSATLNGTTTVCTGSSANLTATISGGNGPYSLTYSNGSSTTAVSNYASGANIMVSPTTSTTYTLVRVTDANACAATVSGTAVVTVNQPPTPSNAGASQTIITGNSATLAANTPTTGTGMWSVASGPSTSAAQFSSTTNPTATFTPAGGLGNYVLTWTISNPPCAPSSSNVTITVAPVPCPQSVTNVTTGETFCTIQAAIDAPNTVSGHTISVGAGTYNEQVLVNKSVSIVGVGSPRPVVNFTGTPALASGRLTLFEVTVPNVTIQNLQFTLDLTKVGSAILASVALPGSVSGLTVQNNDINPYRSGGQVAFGLRNAVSINYAAARVSGSNPANLLITGNTITYNDGGTPGNLADDAAFRAGIATDEGGGTFTGNTILSSNQDIEARFGSAGAITITGNNINGGGVNLAEYNAGAGAITVSGNNFNGTFGSTFTSALRLKNNTPAIPTTVSGNTFTGHNQGISLENYQAVTVDNNTFTPATASTTYRHITVNTKEFSSSSGGVAPAVSLTLTRNTFTGSSSPTSGTAVFFANQDNDNPTFGPFVLGTAGNENNFAASLGTFIALDNTTGPVAPNGTTAVPFAIDLNATNNRFDVGSGLKLAQNLTAGERATLETKLFHKPDVAALGLITYFSPVRNVTQGTFFNTIQSAIDAATANDVIELAETTFNERATVTKPLTLTGVSQTGTIIDGTNLSDGNGFTLQDNVAGISIGNLTIRRQTGSANSTGNGIRGQTNSNLTITNVSSVSNATHGIVLETQPSGTLFNVSVINSTLSSNGVGTSGRGFIIFNSLKQNITLSGNLVQNNGLTGIDINEGTATGVSVTSNTLTGNGDAGISLLGALATGGPNLIASNIVTDNGRFGMEIKSSIGTGATSGPGSLVIENNTVTRTTPFSPPVATRDLAGIAVIRRAAGVSVSTVETPQNAVVRNNTVSGFINNDAGGEGFGIVVEGTNYQVTGNTVTNNEIGIQEQKTDVGARGRTAGTPADGDSPQGDATPFFDRGNSIVACGVVTGNNVSGNTIADTRGVGTVAGQSAIVTNTTTGAVFCTIQSAVDAAAAGNTITVGAGTFPESVTVTKSLTLNGAQAGIDPRITGTAARSGGETIVTAPVNNTANGNLFTVKAQNVIIDGFTFDGDNPTVTGGLSVSGTDINTARAIANGSDGNFDFDPDGLIVRNNIIKNLARYGLTLFFAPGAPATLVTDNALATQNVFANIRQWSVYAENNNYVSVINNKTVGVRGGILISSCFTANGGGITPQVTGNDVESERRGMFYNLFFQNGTPYTVANNTFRSSGLTNTAVIVSSLLNGGHVFTGNTITAGATTGFYVWNVPAGFLLSGGTIDGATRRAVLATNRETEFGFGDSSPTNSLTVSGVAITNSPVGVLVFDNPAAAAGLSATATVTDNTQISGTGAFTAVAISGPDASAGIVNNAASFIGNGSGVGVDVDGGTAGVTTTRITNFATGINVSNGGRLTSVMNSSVASNTGNGIVYAADAGATQGMVNNNDLSGNATFAIDNNTATNLNATCNWYGVTTNAAVMAKIDGPVTYQPFLQSGTDSDPAPGFQPAPGSCQPAPPTLNPTTLLKCPGEPNASVFVSGCGMNNFRFELKDATNAVVFSATAAAPGNINNGENIFTFPVPGQAGTYIYSGYCVDASNGANLSAPANGTLTVETPPAVTLNRISSGTVCPGSAVTLEIQGCSTNPLYFTRVKQSNTGADLGAPGNSTATSTFIQFAAPTTAGTYTYTAVCVNQGSGCETPDNQRMVATLVVQPTPAASLTASSPTICIGNSVTLIASGCDVSAGSNYLYRFRGVDGSGNPSSAALTAQRGENFLVIQPATTGTFSYSVECVNGADGCVGPMGSTSVTVNPNPTVAVIAPDFFCSSKVLSLSATVGGTGPFTYAWTSSDGAGNPFFCGGTPAYPGTCVNPLINFGGSTTTYTLVVTDANSCTVSGSKSVTAVVTPNTPVLQGTPALTSVPGGYSVAVCTGSPVSLSALVDGGTAGTYSWSLNGATAASTTFEYTVSGADLTTPGDYTVTVRKSDGNPNADCDSGIASLTITVNALPTATLVSNSPLTCAQNSVTLTATGGGTYAFAGPGLTSSDPVAGTAVATTAGTYTVTVTSASGCSAIATTSVTSDTAATMVSLVSSNSLNCSVTSATLTANISTRAGTYTYAFSAGASQIGTSNQATINAGGVYSVTVTSANSCSVTGTTSVASDTAVPMVSLVSSNSLNCSVTSATLTATSGMGYTYAFSAGATQIGTSNQATITQAGEYSVIVTTASSCSATARVNVMTEARPTLSGASQAAPVCVGSPATINLTGLPENATLTVGYSINGVAQSPASVTTGNSSMSWLPSDPIPFQTRPLTAADNGTTLTITSLAFTSGTCSQTFNTPVTLSVNPAPVATLSANGTLTCAQTSVTLTAGGGQSYLFGGPGIVSQSTSGSAVVNMAGTYSVTVTSASGCTSTTTTAVTSDTAVPMVSLVSSNSLNCSVTSATLTANASGGSSYTYAFSAGASQIGTSNQATVMAGGSYSVMVTSVGGCSMSATTSVTSDTMAPVATLMSSNDLSCSVTSTTLTGGGGQNYNFSGPGFAQNGPASTAVVSQPGTYTLVVTGTNGCSAVVTSAVNQSTTVVTPDFATRGNQGIPDGLTSVTVLQNSAPVTFQATNCSGTLNWSGNGQMGTTTLNASTSATGVFVYQAVCMVGSCVSSPASVTVTVNPVPVVTQLTVLQRDPDNGQLFTNTLKPYLQLRNDGTAPIPYSEITVRYWLTVEEPAPLVFQVGSQLGNGNVVLKQVPVSPVRQGADNYIEYSFTPGAGSLPGGGNSGEIQTSVRKENYSLFNQGNDYSYVLNRDANPNPRITAYRNGQLIYGVEPGGVVNTPLTVTLTANPTTITTAGTTTLQATVAGGMGAYSYTFSGPGTITQNGTSTASASNQSAGVMTFTVMVTDLTMPVNQTTSASVSVQVNPAPVNTAPTATANSNQTATVGMQFSYQANAFGDAETPNSLTYTASISPANSLIFNPATRVVSGTPMTTGVSSVTITATDSGGLSASTVFTITVNPAPVVVTPLALTFTASPTTILTTGTTTLSATVSGGTPGYSYSFAGPGTISASGNTATVSNLPAGVQIFTVVASDATSPNSQTISGTVSVTVNTPTPANQPPVATANNNQTATVGMQFSYTVNAFNDETPQSLTYTASISPTNGLIFNAATRVVSGTPMATGVSSVTITATDPGSLSATTTFTITVNPAPMVATQLTVLQRDPDNGQLNTNTLKPYLQLRNDGTAPIPYSEITVRYWLTVEEPAPLVFQVGSFLGNGNVVLNQVPVSPVRQGADNYIEFSFTPGAGSLPGGGNSGDIQTSVRKENYSGFNQGNDYSYVLNRDFAPNPRITAYRNGQLIYGIEPGVGTRLAAEATNVPLIVRVLGNPVTGSEVSVEVQGAAGEPLQLRLTDGVGHVVAERSVKQAGSVERQRLSVGKQPAGLLFLQVSTPTQSQTVKLMKLD